MWVDTQQKLSECLSIDASVQRQCYISIVLFSSLTKFLVADHCLIVFIYYYFLSEEFHMHRYLRGEKRARLFSLIKKSDAIGWIP